MSVIQVVQMIAAQGKHSELLTLLRHAVQEGFVRPEYAALLLVEPTPAALLDRFAAWQPLVTPPIWLDPTET